MGEREWWTGSHNKVRITSEDKIERVKWSVDWVRGSRNGSERVADWVT